MLRLVRPAVGRPMMVQPRRGLMAKAMDPETLDAAIREMNQEMEDLFGSPVGSDARPSQPAQQHEVPSQRVVPSDVSAAVTAAPGSSAIDSATARSALLRRITQCAGELNNATATDEATKLATCIAECARAVTALEQMK